MAMKSLLLLGIVAASNVSPEEMLQDWSVSGSNRFRLEDYHVHGDSGSSPYANLGTHYFNDFSLNLNKALSPYERIDARLSGTVNHSDYRSTEEGVILERASFGWEKGDTEIPFRLEAGDFFAFQSMGTLQRSLKGVKFDLQPDLRAGGRDSMQVFAGQASSIYRNLEDDQELYAGVSWVRESELGSALALNYVHAYKEASASNSLGAHQSVFSLAGNYPFKLAEEDLTFESELSYFDGDHNNGSTSADMQDKSDTGLFFELAGRSQDKPLRYQFSYRRYGEDYLPFGASVAADQRALESRANWRFESGLQLGGRIQHFRNSLESANPTDTGTVGVTLSGTLLPAWLPNLTGSLNTYAQDRQDKQDASDTLTRSLGLNLSHPLQPNWIGKFGFQGATTRDHNAGSSQVSRQLSLGVTHDFVTGSRMDGTLDMAMVLRRNTGSSDTSEVRPRIALNLGDQTHSIRFSHSTTRYMPDGGVNPEVETDQTSLGYSFTRGQHRLSLEADYFGHRPDQQQDTDAYRIAINWQFTFDRPKSLRPLANMTTTSLAEGVGVPSVYELSPYASMNTVERRLQQSQLLTAVHQAGADIYEVPLLDDLDLRQRLALFHNTVYLEQSALLVDFTDSSDITQMSAEYDKAREVALNHYGPPDTVIEQGAFSALIQEELTTGQFVRVMEWKTKNGYMRFGIPKRSDGLLRMELVHAHEFTPIEHNDWGLLEIR